MNFKEISELFEKLEKENSRINKILILRNFLDKNNPEKVIEIFDIIVGNYQRNLDKRKIGISIRTMFDIFSFLYNKKISEIESVFNKVGDIGELAKKYHKNIAQKSFIKKKLTLHDLKKFYQKIIKFEGTNSNKKKKEEIGKLFLQITNEKEALYLSRLLIGDLRIGVNEGTIKETLLNYLFLPIEKIHNICPDCSYINLGNSECKNCSQNLKKTIKKESELNIDYIKLDRKYEQLIKNNENTQELKNLLQKIKKIENNPTKIKLIRTTEPRKLYNFLYEIIEKKYNLLNSFQILYNEIKKDIRNLLNLEIKLGIPIKSMLGIKVETIDEGFKTVGKPALLDFKYDGLRMQIHNNKGEIKIFTRNLEEITEQFPEIIEHLKQNYSDFTFVIDSECVGYNYETQKFIPFQSLSKRILTKEQFEIKNIKITLRIFDIIYLNGETLINKKYKERREYLKKLFLNKKIIQKYDAETDLHEILKYLKNRLEKN